MASTTDLTTAREVFDTNLFGIWRVCQAFLPLIRQSPHGRIVMVSSGAGSHGEPQFGLSAKGGAAATYGISKAALNALTSKLAAVLEGSGVLVNAVDPGLTATNPGAEAMGARPVPEGAASAVWAATLPDDGFAGGLFRAGEPLPW
jgi:NAD(P)-dependent dehydrogenase (short-subunit alcohol dehydrogenase family)